MNKDNKLGGTSGTMPTVLTPVAKPPGVAKVFILTPEVLQKLGLAGHLTARIASRDVAKQEVNPTVQGRKENSDEKSHKLGNTVSEVPQQAASSSNTQNTEYLSTENATETSATLNSCISTQLKQRPNGTDQKIPAEGNTKSDEDAWITPKTKKQRRRSNALDMLDAQPQNLNSESSKESKDESSKSTPGVRTSKRVVKLKKFDDYILTDDVLSHVISGSATQKGKQRRSSVNSKKDCADNLQSKIGKKKVVDAKSAEKVELGAQKNLDETIHAPVPKQAKLETKDRVSSSQEISFKVPESRIDFNKKEVHKAHGKSKPKEKRIAEKTALHDEKESTEEAKATTSKSKILQTNKSESFEKSCLATALSSTNVSQKGLYKEGAKLKPNEKSAIGKVAAKKATTLKRPLETASQLKCLEASNNLSLEQIKNIGKSKPKEKSITKNVGLQEATNSREAVDDLKFYVSKAKASGNSVSSEKMSFTVPQSATSVSRPKSLTVYKEREPKEKSHEERVNDTGKGQLEAILVQKETKNSLVTENVCFVSSKTPSDINKRDSCASSQTKEQARVEIIDSQHETRRNDDSVTVAFMQGNTEAEKSLFTEKVEGKPDEIKSIEEVQSASFSRGYSETENNANNEKHHITEPNKREPYKTYVRRKLKEKIVGQGDEKKSREEGGAALKHRISDAENCFSHKSYHFNDLRSSTTGEKGSQKTCEKHEKSTTEKVTEERPSMTRIETLPVVQQSIAGKSDPSTEATTSTESLGTSLTHSTKFTGEVQESVDKKTKKLTVSRKSVERDALKTKTPKSSYKNDQANGSKLNSRAFQSNQPKIIEAEPVPVLLPDKTDEFCNTKRDVPISLDKKEVDCSKSNLLTCRNEKEDKSATTSVVFLDEKAKITAPDASLRVSTDKSVEDSSLEPNKEPIMSFNKKDEAEVSVVESPRSPDGKEQVSTIKWNSSKSADQNKEASYSKPLTNEIPSFANHSNSYANTELPQAIETINNKETTGSSLSNSSPYIEAMLPPTVVSPRTSRKRGRPKKTESVIQKAEIEPESDVQIEEITTTELPAVVPTTDDTSVESTSRAKKPVLRYVDGTDGKGLSDESENENATLQLKTPKRRGRPPGVVSKSWKGGRNRGKGRSRGRGRRQSGDSAVDSEYVPRVASTSEKKNQEELNNSEEPQEGTSTVCEVECAKCKEQMTKKQWPRHNAMTHNGMGWLTGTEEPDFENNVKLLRSTLMATLKKKKSMLICETCGTAKRSANGFISHLQFCGKSEEERRSLLVTCPICNNVMMPSSMEMHERSHRQVDKSLYELKWEEALEARDASWSRGKRKAAEKAATKISEFTELVKDGSSISKQLLTEDLFELIKKPRSSTDPPNIWRGIWKNELTTNGKAFCRQPLCQFTGDTMEVICEHSATCPFTPRPMFMCKVCHFSAETEDTVYNHVQEKHCERKHDSSSDYEGATSSSEEDSDPELELRQPVPRKEGDRFKPQSTGIKFLDVEPPIDPKLPVCFPPALGWTMEFELKNYRLRLFEKLTPRSMNLLPYKESLEYMPELPRSMHVKQAVKRTDKEAHSWMRWERFEGCVNDGVPSMFIGGAVWALAWLPIPAPMYDLTPDQYIAVSTHPTMEAEYCIGKSYTGKNMIQIWNMGPLDHYKNSVLRAPEFSYGVAHNKGTVWCLEWCPSGCYEHESFREKSMEQTPKDRVDKKRMGLLAAACSDGCVHIFSLPFPEELNIVKNENDAPDHRPIFKTEPVLTLAFSTPGYESNEQNWQCMCLNWNKSHGHDTLIAGFSNGYVALWHLTSTSPLLVTTRGETTILDVFQGFPAHRHAVTSVHILPHGKCRFFYTASYDRFIKLWDLENLATTVGTTKRGIVTTGSLFTHWAAYVTAYDDAYRSPNMHSDLVPLRQSATRVLPVLPTKSTVYGIATSDYGNSICQGTLAGEILVMFPHQLWFHKDMERDVPKKRWVASTTQIVDLKASEISESIKTGAKRKTMDNKYIYMPETYKECDDRFGIIFQDELTRSRRDVRKSRVKPSCADQLSSFNIEQYPFASANRVSWNPNAWSYLWLGVGYQSGFVRFLNFRAVAIERALRQKLPPHANAMLEKERGVGTTNTENIVPNS